MVLCGRPLVKILCMRYGHSPQVVWKPNGKCNSTRLALTVRCKLFRQLSEPLFFSCLENFPLQIQVINALSKHKRGAGEGETYKSVSCAISNAYFCISLQKSVSVAILKAYIMSIFAKKGGGGWPPPTLFPGSGLTQIGCSDNLIWQWFDERVTMIHEMTLILSRWQTRWRPYRRSPWRRPWWSGWPYWRESPSSSSTSSGNSPNPPASSLLPRSYSPCYQVSKLNASYSLLYKSHTCIFTRSSWTKFSKIS